MLYRGKHYEGWYDLYRNVNPRPVVSQRTADGRLWTRRQSGTPIDDAVIDEILYLPKEDYLTRYRTRKTLIDLDGKKVDLSTHYRSLGDVPITYRNYRQRIRSLEKRRLADIDTLCEAALRCAATENRVLIPSKL